MLRRIRLPPCGAWTPGRIARAVVAILVLGGPGAIAEDAAAPLRIAAALTLSGPAGNTGAEVLQGIRMALEEAEARGQRIALIVEDDAGGADGAREAARRIAGGDALAVIGPSLSAVALAADPVYAEAGLAVLSPNIATDAATGIFRLNLSQSRVGEALADYLHHALGGRRAAVIHSDDDYGRPLALGFRRGAERLGIAAEYHAVSGAAQALGTAWRVAGSGGAEQERPAIVLGMLETAAVPLLRVLRRADVPGPFLGTASFAYGGYARSFAAEPEERERPGFFTDGLYAASPVLFDSGGAALLAFEERFRARYGHDPSWRAVLAYDAMGMLLASYRALAFARGATGLDAPARRRAVREAIRAVDSPARAFPGLSGPIWFDDSRARPASAVRIGRFDRDAFESAPLQLVPVANPTLEERLAGMVVPVAGGGFARFQRVVFAGIYLNEIARLDVPQSSFTADFYLWIRSAAAPARPTGAEPADIQFPDLRRGDFDAALPAVQRLLPDGSSYRLWHVRGEFRSEFDLRRFPFDRQTVAVRLFNARAASDRIVYALDRRQMAPMAEARAAVPPAEQRGEEAEGMQAGGMEAVAAVAFRHLTQWRALRAEARRDVLVTHSALGDPLLVGAERVRELSGFRIEVELRRRTLSTLTKSLLPIGLMTLMMFASLWFPASLVRDKIVMAVTGALSAAVLLSSINTQLGNVAYTMDVEYAFYVFFALALLCTLSVSFAEQLRAKGRGAAAVLIERATRIVFILTVSATAVAGWIAGSR